MSSASMGTMVFQHSTAQTQVFVHPPCAVCYALQMTLIMATVTTTTMTTSVATTAMSMATTTLVVDLLQQLLLPQAESTLAAHVLELSVALVAAVFGYLSSAVYLMVQWCQC